MRLKELAELQNGYLNLLKNGITKKAMCDLVIPFRDKWWLSDKQALMIARNEIGLGEICKLMNNPHHTEADRIRTMSDEELAEWINSCGTVCATCAYSENCVDPYDPEKCWDGILKRLQQPAEEVPDNE